MNQILSGAELDESQGVATWESRLMILGVWREITDVYGGKITKASYRFSDRMVTVRTSFGSKTTKIGGQTLGLTVPPALLSRADEVIE